MANSYGQENIGPGDEIIVTRIEHHANIVPWQLLAQRTGAVLKVAPVDERGELQLDRFAALLGPRTKFVSVTHVANSLGTVVPVEAIIGLAHAHGVPVLVDAAQSSPHLPIDVTALDRTSWFCPATRSSGRPASASSTARSATSTRCHPGRAAAT